MQKLGFDKLLGVWSEYWEPPRREDYPTFFNKHQVYFLRIIGFPILFPLAILDELWLEKQKEER